MKTLNRHKLLILEKAKDPTKIGLKKFIYDTNYLLYNFRLHRHADKHFTTQLTNDIVKQLDYQNTDGEKTRMINLISMLHLKTGFKLDKLSVNKISDNMEHIESIPNLRWLLDLMTVYSRSGFNDSRLWSKFTKSYSNESVFSSQKNDLKIISCQDLVKLCWNAWYCKNKNIDIWKKMIEDFRQYTNELNPSQIMTLMKIFANLQIKSLFDNDFRQKIFVPFVNDIIVHSFTIKKNMIVNEAVSILVSLYSMELINEMIIKEYESIIKDKIDLLTSSNMKSLVKIYTNIAGANVSFINSDNISIIDKLQKSLIVKMDKNISFEDAINFQNTHNILINSNMMSYIPNSANGIAEYNHVYIKFLIENKFGSFRNILLAKFSQLNFSQVNNFCFLIQGLIIRKIELITYENIFSCLELFAFRSELSKNFIEQILIYTDKFLKNDNEDIVNMIREKFFALFIVLKYDKNSFKQQNKNTSLFKEICNIMKNKKQHIEYLEIFSLMSTLDSEKITPEIWKDISKIVQDDFDNLEDNDIIAFSYAFYSKLTKGNSTLYSKITGWIIDNHQTLRLDHLCKIYPYVIDTKDAKLIETVDTKILQNKLEFVNIEPLTLRCDKLTENIILRIESTFEERTNQSDITQIEIIYKIILNCLKNSDSFSMKFLGNLMKIISVKNQFFNQKILDDLIHYSTNIKNKQK